MREKKINAKNFWKEISAMKNKRIVAITAIDEIDFFSVLYQFDLDGNIFQLRVKLDKQKPIVQSIHSLFPSAIYYECEIHDFFGIEFEGNNRLHDKLFLPDDFKDKPPLLKT